MTFGDFFRDKKVLVTGDTGFKGSWLAFWLKHLGAKVYGIALTPPTQPSNYEILQLDREIEHHTLDIRDQNALGETVRKIKPDVIFHLAAQAIVRRSYEMPLETLETNFLGTAYLLQAIRDAGYSSGHPCSVVAITSDKCYENRETYYAYREDDPMGGHDVYSMSKGTMELLVSSWRKSFFPVSKWASHGVSLVTARAGNVIGGGDWAKDRIMVDCLRALTQNEPIIVRNPHAIRPWQHVLEPLSGYLQLAAEMGMANGSRPELLSMYNFGPGRDSERTVEVLVESAIKYWGGGSWKLANEANPVHEANFLKLSTDKAWHVLQWRPVWNFDACIQHTVAWHKHADGCNYNGSQMRELTLSQIREYTTRAQEQGVRWAQKH